MKVFRLPSDFLMGTATASLQIEGGDTNNSWYRWAEQGHIKDGSPTTVACDHWNRVEEDIALMKRLNNDTYRMSIEWSRIEPQKGVFDKEAMAHYRWEIQKLVEAGIRPLVTLHHFSNPLWLEDSGSWVNPEVVRLFQRYVGYVAENLSDLVSDWVTINEPNVYAINGYVFGVWPPGKKSVADYFKVSRNMVLAHIEAYKTIHAAASARGCKDTAVGVAHHIRVLDAATEKPVEKWLARLLDRLFHEVFVVGMAEGRLIFPVGSGYPLGKGRYQDFFGLNYYSRDMVRFAWNPSMMFSSLEVKQDAPVNDLGWEIYPEGLYRLCKRYWDRYNVPIFITENGTCDARDAFRAKYIYDHLYQVARLIQEGVDVRRYYHWTLMDNFEWVEGFTARFGLYETNFHTQERVLRKSGMFFGELCKNKGVTEEMIREFLGGGL